jgi:YNFM family putative membrane transporter
VLFYYLGGFAGITASGFAWQRFGWAGVVAVTAFVLVVPLTTGIAEMLAGRSLRTVGGKP